MVEKLAEIMSDFPGEANRARCLAHIVNLVAKIILRQFDKSKKKKKKNVPEEPSGNDKELEDLGEEYDEEEEKVLDKEEKEMDEGNDDEGKDDDNDVDVVKLARDIEIIEEAMEVKPVRQVLYKVHILSTLVILPCFRSSPFFLPFFFFFNLSSSFLTFLLFFNLSSWSIPFFLNLFYRSIPFFP